MPDPRINPWTGRPYNYQGMGDFLARGVGQEFPMAVGGAFSQVPPSIQSALGPLSNQFYGSTLPGLFGQGPLAAGVPQPTQMSQPTQMPPDYNDEMTRVYGPTIAGILHSAGRGLGLANPFGLPSPNLGPTAGKAWDYISSLFGGGQEAKQEQPTQAGTQALPSAFAPQAMQGIEQGSSTGAAGPAGGGGTMRGTPLPRSPKVEAPSVDIGKLFDPIIAQLQDPTKIAGPSKIGGLAQILSGAAQGALPALARPEMGVAGVLAGAAGGAGAASESLRRERQVLESQYQESLQRVQVARAGVLSQKAGAEMDLADSIADAKNKQAELQFNRDVMASQMSQPQVQPLGEGRVMITQWDPNTGQGTRQIIDTVSSEERAMQQAYVMSQIQKNMRPSGRTPRDKVVLDGKEYDKSAVIASGNDALQTDVEKEAYHLTWKAVEDPQLMQEFAASIEEWLAGQDPSNPDFGLSMRRWAEEPQHFTLDFIYHSLLEDPSKRAMMWQRLEKAGVPTGSEAPQGGASGSY